MSARIYLRTLTVINTDPQRRCYNGCNFSERIEYGEWRFFQEWQTLEFAELVAKGLRRETLEVMVVPEGGPLPINDTPGDTARLDNATPA